MKTVKELAEGYKAYAIDMRRTFHQYPEKAMHEFKTSDRIQEELEKMGIPSKKMAGTGVVAYINGSEAGKTIALRADIDALELTEENDVVYKSKNEGLMHACGHDTHAASLLTAAKILNDKKSEFKGRVKLIFQPGEEVGLGAKTLVSEGVLDDVDGIFGIHIWNELESGKVSLEAGPRMAAGNIFRIFVSGKGGHGSMPHQGIDATLATAAIVVNMQSVVARELDTLDPAVVTFGIFNAGTRLNILSGDGYLEGTTRYFSKEIHESLEGIMRRVAEKTAESYRATARLEYETLVPPTINDEKLSEIGAEAVITLLDEASLVPCEKTTGGEDFSYYMEKVPGTFAFVGARNDDNRPYYPHHHPKFDVDEDAIVISSGLYAQYALTYLEKEAK